MPETIREELARRIAEEMDEQIQAESIYISSDIDTGLLADAIIDCYFVDKKPAAMVKVGTNWVDPSRVISVWSHENSTLINVNAVTYVQTFETDLPVDDVMNILGRAADIDACQGCGSTDERCRTGTGIKCCPDCDHSPLPEDGEN